MKKLKIILILIVSFFVLVAPVSFNYEFVMANNLQYIEVEKYEINFHMPNGTIITREVEVGGTLENDRIPKITSIPFGHIIKYSQTDFSNIQNDIDVYVTSTNVLLIVTLVVLGISVLLTVTLIVYYKLTYEKRKIQRELNEDLKRNVFQYDEKIAKIKTQEKKIDTFREQFSDKIEDEKGDIE